MARSADFSGTGVAMITPFENDGSVDYPQLEKLVEILIEQHVDYLVVLGTTAETPALSKEEKIQIIEVVKKANAGRVPLVIGAGGNNTAEVISWINTIGSKDIDAYLSVVPYYNKPSQTGMIQHFSAITSVSDLPVILYNVPGRTAANLAAETTLHLAHEFAGKIIAIKEASGDFNQIMKIFADKPDGFKVISGDDAITLPMISLGAEGVISVIGNALPAVFCSMVKDALNGNYEAARKSHYDLLPFVNLIFKEGNPTGVKALMEILGFGKANLRLPLIPASSSLVSELTKLSKTLTL